MRLKGATFQLEGAASPRKFVTIAPKVGAIAAPEASFHLQGVAFAPWGEEITPEARAVAVQAVAVGPREHAA